MSLAGMFRESNKNFLRLVSKEYGQQFDSIEDIWAYTESQMRKHNTCKKCGMICKDYDRLEIHRGNRECVARQKRKAAELANQEYKPEWKTKKWCGICQVSYSRYFKHDETKRHQDNVDKLLGRKFELKCTICEKPFTTKTQFTRHLKESKICHRKVDSAEKYMAYEHV